MQEFSLDIKKLRGELNLSQQKLSDLTGIPKSRINQFEQRGKIPKIEDFTILKRYFESKNLLNRYNHNEQINVLNEDTLGYKKNTNFEKELSQALERIKYLEGQVDILKELLSKKEGNGFAGSAVKTA